jgi:hypothetical protein
MGVIEKSSQWGDAGKMYAGTKKPGGMPGEELEC